MSQTQSNKNGPSIGAAAAQAAAGHPTPKPADKPADKAADKATDKAADKPADKAADDTAAAGDQAAAPAGKKRVSKKLVFIVVGEVHEFESIVQAEKFLNSDGAPPGDYSVIRGTRTRTSKRVSLR